ncbi:Glyoxylate/hydroxypyruvate reductase B [Serratia fonticola]|uniref:Glyoxylate/hydroxypyruvate reductase B n=1 Tax=Serratia fonticola TaxID=47917 RepID=A0A4U9W204_SERFO|nr:Glyoxylate/hydroxypyruvate reductase B [Serratia fonticola]
MTAERAQEFGVQLAESKQALLAASDFVSVHLVLSDRSRGLIDRQALAQMKNSAFLINTSRAAIVDQQALIEALQIGQIAGAGLDVFEVEPLPADHPLRRLPNVLATPHVGYVADDNYRTYFREAIADIQAFIAGEPLRKLRLILSAGGLLAPPFARIIAPSLITGVGMRVLLAPMEGVLDSLVRELLTEVNDYDLCITEFLRVIDQRLPAKSFYRLCPELHHASRTPSGTQVRVQLLGQYPEWLAENAAQAVELGSYGVDLNCGCPSKHVNGSGGGPPCSKIPN